ncbi:arylsulfatase [Xanthomarina sp. GH4-25]|uniref:arylsulfatase n=1 Tax=Xanthomarina sp. GH4-25 TaxID=3349335 RepID=UPI0038782156
MKNTKTLSLIMIGLFCLSFSVTFAQKNSKRPTKPNIIMLVSDDTGWGDLGVYGGGVGRGMPTPNLDKVAKEGMQFWSFYGQPSCTPGRAAMQTGRIPNRSGMTTVAFQGQGGGLPAAEWTLASVLKKADYNTYFSGKWHLGEDDYAMPTAQGYDIMQNVVLYHLNAYTYAFPSWNPEMSPEMAAFFQKVTKGILEGEAGKPVREISKVTTENIAELDMNMTENVLKQMDIYAKDNKPFFMSINFAKNHQPNLPSKQFAGKSPAKSKYADCVVEMDYNVGRIMDKIRELGIEENTLVVYTVDNGAWQDVYPDAGYTPFRGSKGTDREGGSLVPALAWWPGQIKAGSDNHDIVGGLDYMATFASLAGIELPTKDRDGVPMVFDSYDMSNILFDEGKPLRRKWFYFTEAELSPGAVRVDRWKAVFNTRGDNGAQAGSDMPGQQLGWRGDQTYVATVPAIYDLWADPQERYDIFMTSFTEKTWTLPIFSKATQDLMKTYVEYPPRPLQSETFTGPLEIKQFRDIQKAKILLKEKGIVIPKLEGE